jgi:hypothetical protein
MERKVHQIITHLTTSTCTVFFDALSSFKSDCAFVQSKYCWRWSLRETSLSKGLLLLEYHMRTAGNMGAVDVS